MAGTGRWWRSRTLVATVAVVVGVALAQDGGDDGGQGGADSTRPTAEASPTPTRARDGDAERALRAEERRTEPRAEARSERRAEARARERAEQRAQARAEQRRRERLATARAEQRRAERRRVERRRAEQRAARRSRTHLVTRVVDGDTVELASGEDVRVVGIDTPEVGECGYDEATASMVRLVEGRRVHLRRSDEDRDGYGRLLRYVDRGRLDAGLRQIRAGLAVARYDSRDGYGFHPREPRYVAADRRSPAAGCAAPEPTRRPGVPGGSAPTGCAPGYRPCVPTYPPDLDCADVGGPVRVTGSDPHGLDAEGDGLGCE